MAMKVAHQGVVRVWSNPFWKLALDFIEQAKASAYVNHEILSGYAFVSATVDTESAVLAVFHHVDFGPTFLARVVGEESV